MEELRMKYLQIEHRLFLRERERVSRMMRAKEYSPNWKLER
jgi:hypothetical protein